MSGDLAVREAERVYGDAECDALQRKVHRLEVELRGAQESRRESERQLTIIASVLERFRKHFEPQYRTMQALFGQLDEAGISDGSSTVGGQPIPAEKYTAWKARLTPACGKIIDALLIQPLTQSQLETFCKMHFNTVRNSLGILKGNSLIEQADGKKWRLKP